MPATIDIHIDSYVKTGGSEYYQMATGITFTATNGRTASAPSPNVLARWGNDSVLDVPRPGSPVWTHTIQMPDLNAPLFIAAKGEFPHTYHEQNPGWNHNLEGKGLLTFSPRLVSDGGNLEFKATSPASWLAGHVGIVLFRCILTIT